MAAFVFSNSQPNGLRSLRLAVALLAICVFGCTEIQTHVPQGASGGPAGVITGQIVYSGPLPCTRDARVQGVAVISAYERSALPPPDGVGLSPAGLDIVTADTLFASVDSKLRYFEDGRRWCPSPSEPPVTVSANWAMSPLVGGDYQLRGFFDRDGNFNPAFDITRQPSRGDIAGGAIVNLAEAASGAPILYNLIGLGKRDASGQRMIGEDGARVDGVTVHLALPLTEDRPRFFVESVQDASFGNKDPQAIVVPSDYPIPSIDLSDPGVAESSFIRLGLGAGPAPQERQAASAAPFFFEGEGASFLIRRVDIDQNGVIDASDHVPETSLLPSLAPFGLLTKQDETDALLPARTPMVVMQAMTLFESAAATAGLAPDFATAEDRVLLALRPAVLCLDQSSPRAKMVLLLARDADSEGRSLIEDQAGLELSLEARFGRPVETVIGCLPEGSYSTHLVYPLGQTWSVPNEAGVCGPTEEPSADGERCGNRTRLPSQAVSIRVGPPTDPVYCKNNPTPEACLP